MIARKKETKTHNSSHPTKTRQLARKLSKNSVLGTRLFLSRTRRFASGLLMNSSKKRAARFAVYRRDRLKKIIRKVNTNVNLLSRRSKRSSLRTVSTNKFTRVLYVKPARTLRAAKRRVQVRVRQYKQGSSRLLRTMLRQHRRVARRYRAVRHHQLTRTRRIRYTRTVLAVLRFLRTRPQPVLRRATKKKYSVAALRRLRQNKSRAWGVGIRRYIMPVFVVIKKGKLSRRKKQLVFTTKRTTKRSSKLPILGLKFRLLLARSKNLRSFGRKKGRNSKNLLSRGRKNISHKKSPQQLKLRKKAARRKHFVKKTKFWLLLRRASKRIRLHRRYSAQKQRKQPASTKKLAFASRRASVQKSLQRPTIALQKTKLSRRAARAARAAKRHQFKTGYTTLKLRSIRRKLSLKKGVRRVRRYRQPKMLRPADVQTKTALLRCFLLRRAARRYTWLRLVTNKHRRIVALLPRTKISRKAKLRRLRARRIPLKGLFFLRAAVRTRTKTYKTFRKMLRLRSRRNTRYRQQTRHLGHRQQTLFNWANKHKSQYYRSRRGRRMRRKALGLRRFRGRGWGRWRRIPRHFYSRYAQAVRHAFNARPKSLRRGVWTYFYRDRDSSPRPRSRKAKLSTRARVALWYKKQQRATGRTRISRSRRAGRAQWYTSRTASRRVRTSLTRKNKRLRSAIRRRSLAARHRAFGTAYGFKKTSRAVFIAKISTSKSIRRLCGSSTRGYIRKFKTVPAQRLPAVVRSCPSYSKSLSRATFSSSRLLGLFQRKIARPFRSVMHPLERTVLNKNFTQELQRELDLDKNYPLVVLAVPGKKAIQAVKTKKLVNWRSRHFIRRASRAVTWFKRLHHQLLLVKGRLHRAQRRRNRKAQRAKRRLVATLSFENSLNTNLNRALKFLNKTHAKI